MSRLLRYAGLLATVLAATLAGSAVASAQTIGFAFSGGAQGIQIGVGSFVGTGSVGGPLFPCGSGTTSEVENQTLIAANGDTVSELMTGTVCVQADGSAVFTGTYTITGGTGRFASATGSGSVVSSAHFVPGSITGARSFSQHGTIALNLGSSPGQTTPFEARGSGTITVNLG